MKESNGTAEYKELKVRTSTVQLEMLHVLPFCRVNLPNRKIKQTLMATATGMPSNKKFNKQDNSCVRAI